MTSACGCGTRRRATAIMSYGAIQLQSGVWPYQGNTSSADQATRPSRSGPWRGLGPGPAWSPLLCTLMVFGQWWFGRAGSEDEKIVVSDIVTRQHKATLYAHTGAVSALAVSGRTLLSTGVDCTIRVWALSTWSHLILSRVSEHVPDAGWCPCLAVSGSMLLCGGVCKDGRSGFMVVLDSDTLTCQHTLRLDRSVNSLLSVRGEV